MHIDSNKAGNIFFKSCSTVILQTMLCGDNMLICELIEEKELKEVQP